MAGLILDVRAHAPPRATRRHGRHRMSDAGLSALRVEYRADSTAILLDRPDTLAVLGFGAAETGGTDPRHLCVPLRPLSRKPPRELWAVGAEVATGRDDDLRWAAGGGWPFIAIEVDEARFGGIEAASEHAYTLLTAHVAACPERYRLFCNGRARGLAARGIDHYPAATAIGHHGPRGLLQVYALCATQPGRALENPRQVSAWQYPRQYGPTAPSFARAMRLPNAALAISGTAAVIGHASRHHDDVAAQADEAFANLATLLERAQLSAFDARSPLKVYVRNADDVPAVEAALARRLDAAVPRVLLQGDVCRSELLVEIDGWRFAS